MKKINFQGDLTDISAMKEPLIGTSHQINHSRDGRCHLQKHIFFDNENTYLSGWCNWYISSNCNTADSRCKRHFCVYCCNNIPIYRTYGMQGWWGRLDASTVGVAERETGCGAKTAPGRGANGLRQQNGRQRTAPRSDQRERRDAAPSAGSRRRSKHRQRQRPHRSAARKQTRSCRCVCLSACC